MLVPIGGLREDAPMGVLAIWRYPVKAMLGELLDTVGVGPTDPRRRACRERVAA